MGRGVDLDAAREGRQIVNEFLPGRALGDVAAIKLDRARGRKRSADLGKRTLRGAQTGVGDQRGAELKFAARTVRNDRDRREVGEIVGRKEIGDLLKTVARRIEHEDLRPGIHTLNEVLKIRNARINKDDLLVARKA
jgi:hypothetical protein